MFGHINDNRGAPVPEPDAHGQAALLLAESTLHVLIENGTLTGMQALTAVQSAASIRIDGAAEADESPARLEKSLALLSRIAVSLKSDLI